MLDEKLLQQRLREFNPEPLVDYNDLKTKDEIEVSAVIDEDHSIDLAKANYLNVLDNNEIKKECENIIRNYGVGTCGPRAFYGTTDVHLELEERLAAFLGMEEAIVYSYGFVAISSSIAAYCKKSDIVFIDKNANFPIHQGLQAAKSKIVYFDHVDPESLRNEVNKISEAEKNKKRPSRKFLIVEGVSWKTGKICPLVDFVKIAEDYKMRIFLEETYSFGVFGKTGKGLTEHFEIDPTRIDMIIGTLEAAIGSIGGFCAGSQLTIEHQRLSGAGYIFSASLPTYLVQATIKSIDMIGNKPNTLIKFAKDFHDFLKDECNFFVESDPESPFKVFGNSDKNEEIYNFCRNNRLYFIFKDNRLIINLNVDLHNDKKRLQLVYDLLKKASEL